MPIFAITARMMSFAVTPGLSAAVHAHRVTSSTAVAAGTASPARGHLAGADAECQCAERSVRGRVAVAADHRHARLCQSLLRSHDVHDALLLAAQPITRDSKVAAILLQLLDLRRRDLIENRQTTRRGRRRMIHRRDGQIRPPDLQSAPRRPSNACGEVTSCTRCRSMYNSAGASLSSVGESAAARRHGCPRFFR
jgi:hypothetical protein